MDAEKVRAFCRALPHVVETRQWGDNLLFWVADQAIGGKMMAMLNLEPDGRGVLSFYAGPERYHELLEIEGIHPAPYLARLSWVAVHHWSVLSNQAWEAELRAAHALTLAKLPAKVHAVLALPPAERKRQIAARKKLLAERAEAKKQAAPKQKAR